MLEQTYRKKKEMFAIAVDFKKAYDSIRRETILEILKEYRVDINIVDFVKRIYTGDSTIIQMGEGEDIEMKVESGIRQGCTASTLFFKLITYKIIEALQRTRGVRTGSSKVTCLFYADDGLVLADNVEQARESIRIVKETGEKYGLQLNENKSQCIMFNVKENINEVEGIGVVKEIKYLGIIIRGKKDMFEGQREQIKNKVKVMSNMTNSVIERSCHRTLIGKTYWKAVVVPNILYGVETINMNENEIERIQRTENSAMRRVLKAPRYAPLAAIRGEIGITNMKTRICRGRIQYVRRVKQGNNTLLKTIMKESKEGRMSTWWRYTEKYMRWANIREEELENMTRNEVKTKIAKVAEEEWRRELEERSTLYIYRRFKMEMREEDYEGGERSLLWFRARSNCLSLGEDRWQRRAEECRVCRETGEDIEHFILDCMPLEEQRKSSIVLQRPRLESRLEVMGEFLFGEGNARVKRETLYNMWLEREVKMRRQPEE